MSKFSELTLTDEEVEASEVTSEELKLLCDDLENLCEINREFSNLVIEQDDSINILSQNISVSEASTRSSVGNLKDANILHAKYQKYRMLLGLGIGTLVAGPVGGFLGIKVATGVFIATTLITGFL